MRKLIILLPLLLASCAYNQTGIQGDYEGVRKDCQSDAEDRIDQFGGGAQSEKDRNAELVTLFSDCMAKEGWQVATPKREMSLDQPGVGKQKQEDVPGNPTVPLTPQPPAPTQNGAVRTESTALSPSPGMPPLRQPVNPNAATYQPAPQQPNVAPAPYYGTPGRNF